MAVPAVAALFWGSSIAQGATTRAEYASQVNQICTVTNNEVRLLERAYRARVRREKPGGLSKLDVRFDRRVLELDASEIAQLSHVSAAPGDEALVSDWLLARQALYEVGVRRQRLWRKLIRQARHIRTRKDDKRFERLQAREERLGNRSVPFIDSARALGTHLGASACVERYGPAPPGFEGFPIPPPPSE